MFDGWEVLYSLDPLYQIDALFDFDIDGLKNAEEFIHRTKPNESDSDGDGYSDGVEVAAGTDPLNPNSYPMTPVPDPESILLELSIIIGGVTIAAAIITYGFLRRSRPKTTQLQSAKKSSPTNLIDIKNKKKEGKI